MLIMHHSKTDISTGLDFARIATLLISSVIPHNTAGIIEFSTALLCMLLTFWGQNVYRNSVVGNFATTFF